MKYLLLLGCGLILCVSLGNSLQCYSCAISTSKCRSNPVNCFGAAERCFLQVGKAAGITAYISGCTVPANCGHNFQQSFAGVTVSLTTTCCDTDLCNGSDHIKPSLLLCLMLAAFWFARFL